MTKQEFGTIMAYISAAVCKTINEHTVSVYFDLLGDLPKDLLLATAKRVVLDHKWSTFPTVAELHEAAIEMSIGKEARMPPQVAWSLAVRAAGRFDPEMGGAYAVSKGGVMLTYESQIEYLLEGLPPLVTAAMRVFGIHRLAGDEPIGVLQAQFCGTYANLLKEAKRDVLLPPSLAKEMMERDHPAVKALLKDMGNMPE